jgi:KUP system potassium uptake protein
VLKPTYNNISEPLVQTTKSSLAALTLGAIGVVYGDIGTSVLYAMKEVFGSGHVPFTPQNVYGILSIFFWTLTVIVSIKYVLLVLRADNHGEGGLIAMLALASTSVKEHPRLRRTLLALGIFGTCLFYGDGVITPAISVLSAVEGLEVISPEFKKYVVPLTLVIVFFLFLVQKRGTTGIGKFFGPITLVWFGTIAVLGVAHIADNPAILLAISPHYALGFILAIRGLPSSSWVPLFCASQAQRLCTQTWAILVSVRFALRGLPSSCLPSRSTILGKVRCCCKPPPQ